MADLPTQKQSAYFVRKAPKANPTTAPSVNQSNAPAQAPGILNIPGTKTSLQNSQLLTPLGIPSIDSLISKHFF